MMKKSPAQPLAAKRPRRASATKRVLRSKGRPKRDDHKVGAETLILRTCDLLRTTPPHKITIAAVARHAGVNPALIRYYFGDRSALMLAVAHHLLNETAVMREPLTTPRSAERSIRRMVRSLIELHREYPAFRELFFNDIMNMPSAEARRLFSETIGDGVARARSVLMLLRGEDAERSGDSDIEPALLHLALIGMGELYVSAFKMIETGAGSKLDRDRVDKQFVDFVANMLLHGLRGAGESDPI
jgi:TetR/AcrR family transcriptional regulator